MRDPQKNAGSRIMVIGIGNEFRHDDCIGIYVARQLLQMNLGHISIQESTGEALALIEAWNGQDTVIMVDAASSGARPGTIHRFRVPGEQLPLSLFKSQSMHDFGINQAIGLARTMNELPANLIVYGIEGKSFESGVGLSLEVEQAAQDVIQMILQDVGRSIQES